MELFLALPQSSHSINSISKVKSGGKRKKSPGNLNRQKPLPFIPAVTASLGLSFHTQTESMSHLFLKDSFFHTMRFFSFHVPYTPFLLQFMASCPLAVVLQSLQCSLETVLTNTQAEACPPSLGLACFALVNITISGPSQRKPEQEHLLLKHLHSVPAEQLHTKH